MAKQCAPRAAGPVEPVLELDDIQGIAVPGFFKPHQTLLGLQVSSGEEPVRRLKRLLAELAPDIATGRATLADRRQFRRQRGHKPTGFHRPRSAGVVLLAIAFTHRGLRRLTPGADAISSEAFRQGLPSRAALLGDPAHPRDDGHPSRWVVGKPGDELDALLVVAGDHRAPVDARVRAVKRKIAKYAVTVAYEENGDVLEGDLRGHEHFGFDDGVSQPGIRGRASEAPYDYITDRHIDPGDVPAAWLFGYPGQDLVWPGELVLGYPATSPDPLVPGPARGTAPDWTRNGSFLVFRRLRQDVGLFWHTMDELAGKLSSKPGFAGTDAVGLASRLVGRWRSGAPFNRVPNGDDRKLGKNRFANNYFVFDSETKSIALRNGERDPFPMAKADPVGTTCPWGAHIRKVNTRDSASDMGSRDSTYNRRLLRVGIPYGEQVRDRRAHHAKGERGLLFLSIQSSIEDQFEFLMARWINDDSRPKMPGGNDMLIGQNAAAEDGIRRCTVFGSGLQREEVSSDRQWVVPTGGGYFFVPSLSALREVLAR
jgi:Dyp-type peroxidase family